MRNPYHSCNNKDSAGLFPEKLHDLLEYSHQLGLHTTVISWTQQGKAFEVYNRDELVKSLLPLFFGQTKYKSFERQLNMWSFDRIVTTTVNGSSNKSTNTPQIVNKTYFHHPYFVRGQVKTLMAKHSLCRESFKRKCTHQTIKKNNNNAHGQQAKQAIQKRRSSKKTMKTPLTTSSTTTSSWLLPTLPTMPADILKMEKSMERSILSSMATIANTVPSPPMVLSSSSSSSSLSTTTAAVAPRPPARVSLNNGDIDADLVSKMDQVETILSSSTTANNNYGGGGCFVIDACSDSRSEQQQQQRPPILMMPELVIEPTPIMEPTPMIEMSSSSAAAPAPKTQRTSSTASLALNHGDLVDVFEGCQFHFLDLGLANF